MYLLYMSGENGNKRAIFYFQYTSIEDKILKYVKFARQKLILTQPHCQAVYITLFFKNCFVCLFFVLMGRVYRFQILRHK